VCSQLELSLSNGWTLCDGVHSCHSACNDLSDDDVNLVLDMIQSSAACEASQLNSAIQVNSTVLLVLRMYRVLSLCGLGSCTMSLTLLLAECHT